MMGNTREQIWHKTEKQRLRLCQRKSRNSTSCNTENINWTHGPIQITPTEQHTCFCTWEHYEHVNHQHCPAPDDIGATVPPAWPNKQSMIHRTAQNNWRYHHMTLAQRDSQLAPQEQHKVQINILMMLHHLQFTLSAAC